MILVTGGTGFAGRHVVSRLLADGRDVRVLTRRPGRVALPEKARQVSGDLADVDSLRAAMRDIAVVVHAAALLPGPTARDELLDRTNAGGTGALALVAREMGVRQLVHVSSAGVYGDGAGAAPHRESDAPAPGDAYERSKLAAETVLASTLSGSPVRWTILRPQGLYGADRPATAQFFRAVARRRLWLHGPARVWVHPTHVDDLAAAVRLAIDRDTLHGEVINVGGARPLDFRELISLVGARIGHQPLQLAAPRWMVPPAAVAVRIWAAFGVPPSRATRLARACINRAVSIEKARRLLGFEPLALESGLDRTVAELRLMGSL